MTPEERAMLPLMRVALYSKAGEPIDWAAVRADIAHHIRAAVAAEREACARITEEGYVGNRVETDVGDMIRAKAAAIRARGA